MSETTRLKRHMIRTLSLLALLLLWVPVPVRAEQPQFTPLGDLAGGDFESRVTGLSHDGSVVIGTSATAYFHPEDIDFGDLYESPMRPRDREGFYWKDGVMVRLASPVQPPAMPLDVSADGSAIVGFQYLQVTYTEPYPMIWRLGDNFHEGHLPGWDFLRGRDLVVSFPPGGFGTCERAAETFSVSDDGSAALSRTLCESRDLRRAEFVIWEWTEETGPRVPGGEQVYSPTPRVPDADAFLRAALGPDLRGWSDLEAVAASADGTTVAGNGINPEGRPEGWLLEVPTALLPSLGVKLDVDRFHAPNVLALYQPDPVEVAVFGSEVVDVREINVYSLAFGPAEAGAIRHPTHRFEPYVGYYDVNHDGFLDLFTWFRLLESGLVPGDQEVCMVGELAGSPFLTCDEIELGLVPPPCGDSLELALIACVAVLVRRTTRPDRRTAPSSVRS